MAEEKAVAPTPEEQEAVLKELQGRVEEFNKELIPLLGKYELGLGASAFIQPNGTIGARPIMFDARNQPKPEGAKDVEPAPSGAVQSA